MRQRTHVGRGNTAVFSSSHNNSSLQVPTMQRSVVFGDYQGPVQEKIERTPQQIGRTQLLVQVEAVGLNPVDAKQVVGDKLPDGWFKKLLHNMMVRNTRVGFDFAGTVVESKSSEYPPGMSIFGTMPPLKGSCAPYIVVPMHQVACMPRNISFAQAAALPLVGLTAWQTLQPHLVAGYSNVLVVGASGGTGHVSLQVAKALGANEIVAVCGTSNLDFCRSCGATQVINYQDGDGVARLEQLGVSFDLVLDCVTSADPRDSSLNYPQRVQSSRILSNNYLYQRLGGPTPDWIRAFLKRVGLPPWWRNPHEQLFWITFPHSSEQLKELGKLAEMGQLTPKISKTLSGLTAANVQEVFDDILTRRVQGKVVIEVVEADRTSTSVVP
jgi:NADPH:quinone reductase-like Zn-dependent oxidoreductase